MGAPSGRCASCSAAARRARRRSLRAAPDPSGSYLGGTNRRRRVLAIRQSADELRLDLIEDRFDLGARCFRLEVVEEDVVRLIACVETLDLAPKQLDVVLERR